MAKSSGRRTYPWPRWVVRVTLANGNTVKSETHLVSRATRRRFDEPDHFWEHIVLNDDDDAWVEMKRRLAVLRAKVKADATADQTGTTRTDAISVAMVPAGVKG